MRYNGAKVRRSRQVGIPLTAKAFRIMQKKSSPPGVRHHRFKKLSGYGTRLQEKQKIKYYFNVTDGYLRKVFKQATSLSGDAGSNFLKILTMRLDHVVKSMGFISSIYHAQQVVGHGKVLVNGKKVNISSYICKEGDVVSIKESFRDNEHLQTYKSMLEPAAFLKSEEEGFKATILPLEEADLMIDVDTQMIVEFYSR